MKTVRVRADEIREIVQRNREQHEKIFREAIDGYRKECEKLLQEHIESLRDGKIRKVAIALPFPENHMRDYDRVIKMLELSTEKEIELSESDFASYVMDDWEWKWQFIRANMPYSAIATEQAPLYE